MLGCGSVGSGGHAGTVDGSPGVPSGDASDPGSADGGPGAIDAPPTDTGPTCGQRGQACCPSSMCELRASCDGTACIAADVWASGVDGTANFNGGSWTHPLLGGTTQPLPGVSALWGTTAAFVVGVGTNGIILRRDGTTWHRDRVPSSDGTGSLFAVSGSSATDVWAVGDGVFSHYDGTGWLDSTAPPSNDLPYLGVWMSSATDGWATGVEGILAHFTGGAWVGAGHIGNGFDRSGIWGFAANNIWKVGSHHTLTGLFAAIDHYDGTSWTGATISGGDLPVLTAVWGSDPSHVWAVGEAGTIVFYDGALWQPILSGTGDDLTAIWGSGPNDVWVAGASGMRHFNGTGWEAIPGLTSPPVAVWLSPE
jgi:hypothetical protein